MDFVRALGIKTDNISSEIYLSEDEKQKGAKLRNLLSKDNQKKIIIGIHTTSGNSAPNWSTSYYKKLINELLNDKQFIVCLTDNNIPETLDKIDEVKYINKNNDLRNTIINLSCLDILVSASTGPLHLAAALKVKTVSLFCNMSACSPKLWKPVGNKSIEIVPTKQYCKTFCPGNPKKCTFANDGITTEQVLNAIKKLSDESKY